jgi:hypothetical protein
LQQSRDPLFDPGHPAPPNRRHNMDICALGSRNCLPQRVTACFELNIPLSSAVARCLRKDRTFYRLGTVSWIHLDFMGTF